MLVENLNSKKTLPLDTLPTWLRNLGEYLQCVPMDAGIGISLWQQVIVGMETLFRRIILSLHTLEEPTYLLDIMVCLLKVPGISKVNCEEMQFLIFFNEKNNILNAGYIGAIFKSVEPLHSEFDCEAQSAERFVFVEC